MTKINKMIMNGFKSFGRKTELVFGDDYNCVIGPNGSGKSTRWDTEILLSTGEVRPIGEIVEESLKKSSTHVHLDDGVYTPENPLGITTWGLEPKSMKLIKKNISAFIRREGDPHLYTITTKTGREVTTTGCHPVMIFKKGKVVSEVVKNLETGMFISTPNKLNFPETTIPINLEGIKTKGILTKNIARLLGYLVGDGSIIPQARRLDFVNADPELLEDFSSITKQLGLKPCFHQRKDTKAACIYVNSKIFSSSLVSLFKKNYKKEGKHIPSQVLFSEKEILSNFLAALFDCDGHVRKDNPTFEYVTMSKRLADNVLLALLRFGIVARKTLKMKYAANTKDKKKRGYYFIAIEGKGKLSKLYRSVPLRCKHKKAALKRLSEADVIENPNNDLIPPEANEIIKKCASTLRLPVKPLRKNYPFFAAYVENRCSPSRDGLRKTCRLLREKLNLFKKAKTSISPNSSNLMDWINRLNLSRVEAAKFIGITRNSITDNWDKGRFIPRPKNLQLLYLFVKQETEIRVKKAKKMLEILQNLSTSDIFWDPIVSIKKVKGEPYVYDLTIPNCHNFIGNGIFVHNSNVLDSLCFVLGKSGAKGLRAEKSSNLIYNGGKSKKPASQGEVSIYFDNSNKVFPTDEKEVKISRIIKPTGQSKYKINDQVVTRHQILDLLGIASINPDGYNIILQGDVIKLIDATPSQKREMLDEISGISMYEEKKNKALNELAKVDVKLGESEIILKERETHLKELKKDRDQALKYKELNDKLIRNKASYCNIQIERTKKKDEDLQKKTNKHKEQVEKHNQQMEELNGQIKEWKGEIKEISNEIEEKGEKEQIKLNKEVEKLRVDVNTNNARIGTINTELHRIGQRKDQLQKNLLELGEHIEDYSKKMRDLAKEREKVLKDKEAIEGKIFTFKKKHKMEDSGGVDKQMEEIDKEAEDKEKQIQALREQQQELLRQKDRLDFQLQSLDQKLAKVSAVEKEHSAEMKNLKSKKTQLDKLSKRLNDLLDESSQSSSRISDTRTRLFRNEEELAKLRIQEVNVKERMFANVAVKKIIENKSSFNGVYGTIGDLGNISSKHSQAMEVAAGPKVNGIVVEDDAVAAKCIKYLKSNKFGTATFLPLNKIKEFPKDSRVAAFEKQKGVLGFAIDLVQFDPKYKRVFSFVFGNTLIVDNIDTARKIGIRNARMATLTGDLTELSGAMHGGFRQKTKASSFRSSDMTKGIEAQEAEIGNLRNALSVYEGKKTDMEDEIEKIRNDRAYLEADIITMEKRLHVSSDDIDATKQTKEGLKDELLKVDSDLDKVVDQISDINRGFAQLKIKKQQLREKITQLRNPRLLAELNAFDQKRRELTEKNVELQTEITGIEAQIQNIFGRDKDNIAKILNDLSKEEESFKDEIKHLKERIKNQGIELKEKEEVQKAFSSKFRGLFEKRSLLNESMIKSEGVISNLQERNRSEEYKLNTFNLENAKTRAELSGLEEEFSRYEGVSLYTSKSEQDLKKEISQCERMKENMGNVNMRALEVYESVEKEYYSLLEKKEILTKEKGDVLMLMNEIESKKKDLFMKTFDVINENFKRIFSNLSTKGSAFLEIENQENPFEGGLLMKVRLRGNKFMDIRSLSGGEKTMTALAFLFAVQENQPASFYILDEVDAALDKHNSEKLAKLIKEYCERAQYIVITHNDAIITEASKIYGVSMDQHGISNITTLEI